MIAELGADCTPAADGVEGIMTEEKNGDPGSWVPHLPIILQSVQSTRTVIFSVDINN
jgi:hypothetical protein